jgi:hypothetical protein
MIDEDVFIRKAGSQERRKRKRRRGKEKEGREEESGKGRNEGAEGRCWHSGCALGCTADAVLPLLLILLLFFSSYSCLPAFLIKAVFLLY